MDASGAIIFLPRESGNETPLLFEDILFTPGAVWLSEALTASGVGRFFVVCHADDRERAASLFPQGTEFVTTGTQDASDKLTAFLSRHDGGVYVITRPVLLMPPNARLNAEKSGDSGVWTVSAAALSEELRAGKEFESALQSGGCAVPAGGTLLLGRAPEQRMNADFIARQISTQRLIGAGVRLIDPNAVYVGPQVTVGAGTVLLPGTILRGKTVIGKNCEIGPNTMIRDCTIGDGVTVNASQLNESTVDNGAKVGPFAYVRPNCRVGRDVKVGDFVELKNSTIGDGTKISHLTYVGDSDVGSKVNFGCGTVTVNYDGSAKFRTTIGDNAFIGCNTNLVAPVKIGGGAYTAAGSTITDDVPDDSLAIARSPQTIKVQWAAKRRKAKAKK
ncbi:MAG: UDP-N-acetylglucosamine diphosphorylase [Clostridia bacterium]|nr:UDP-N-acetylglucosamine diphosphorylase [Clostridia bacterium]